MDSELNIRNKLARKVYGGVPSSMPRSDWCLVATLFGCLALATAALSSTAPAQPYATCEQAKLGSTQGKPYQANNRPRVAGVPGFIQRFTSNDDPCHGEDNEKRDLAAQEAAAVWVFWAAAISVFQLAISGIGLSALLRTIRQGEEGLNVARAANLSAQRIGEAQIRAYVYIKAAFAKIDAVGNFSIALKVGNSGQSPARWFRWTHSGHYALWDPVLAQEFGGGYVGSRHMSTDIASGETIDTGFYMNVNIGIKPEITERMKQIGAINIFVKVIIVWHDVFDIEYQETIGLMGSASGQLIEQIVPLWPDHSEIEREVHPSKRV